MFEFADSAEVDTSASIGESTRIWGLSQIREDVQIGRQCVIGRGVYIDAGVVIGDRCKIQNFAQIYAPAKLGTGVFVGPHVVVTNDRKPRAINPSGALKGRDDWSASGVLIHDGASLGASSVLVAGISVGEWAMIAAGAIVTQSVPNYALVVGVPGAVIGWVGRSGVQLVPDGRHLIDPINGERFTRVGDVVELSA